LPGLLAKLEALQPTLIGLQTPAEWKARLNNVRLTKIIENRHPEE
jgi:hypothetical protein